MFRGGIGLPEILVILVLALVLFGGGKLAGVGKALGKSIKDFKDEVKDDDAKTESGKTEVKKDEPDGQEKA
ncbi:MAG: twin-arginine translocase TatA/TatE family subunit [Clostridia bacterium]|nr:twin-arginine translocase TatA/TatE family subunit [Clostridia bacterium]